jgi:large subunit ribosomal protein L30
MSFLGSNNGVKSKGCFLKDIKVTNKIKITQVRSTSGHIKKQRETIRALGIKRLYQSVEQTDTPQIRGMIEKVHHLVKVEVVNPDKGGEV